METHTVLIIAVSVLLRSRLLMRTNIINFNSVSALFYVYSDFFKRGYKRLYYIYIVYAHKHIYFCVPHIL